MATKKASVSKKTTPKRSVSMDLVRSRAYEIYLKRTRYNIAGDSESDWFRAEKELLN
jgi:hypothetical protein